MLVLGEPCIWFSVNILETLNGFIVGFIHDLLFYFQVNPEQREKGETMELVPWVMWAHLDHQVIFSLYLMFCLKEASGKLIRVSE